VTEGRRADADGVALCVGRACVVRGAGDGLRWCDVDGVADAIEVLGAGAAEVAGVAEVADVAGEVGAAGEVGVPGGVAADVHPATTHATAIRTEASAARTPVRVAHVG
jgi:hypothetical protein